MNSDYFEIVNLIESGDYQAANHSIDNWSFNSELVDPLKLLLKAEILIYQGSYESARTLISKSNELNITTNDPIISLLSIIHQISTEIQVADRDNTSKLISNVNSEFIELLFKTSNWELDYINRLMSRYYHTLGNYYSSTGELELAELNYNDSIKIRREIGDGKGLGSSLNKLSLIYKIKGDLENAETLCQEAIDIENKIQNTQALAIAQYTMGQIQREMGNYRKSIEYLTISLDNLGMHSNPYLVALLNFELFVTSLSKDKGEAYQFFKNLQTVKETNSGINSIEALYDLSVAVNLKNSKRAKERFQAQDAFRRLINSDIFNFKIRLLAIKNLMELLLDEMKISNEDEVLLEFMLMNKKIQEISIANSLYPVLIDSYLLKSQYELIMGELNVADNSIENAIALATEHKLTGKLETATEVKANFEKSLKHYNELSKKGASIINRVVDSEIDKYLASIPSIINLITNEGEE